MNTSRRHLFAVATIDSAGTIRLRLMSQQSESPRSCGDVCYERSHPGYASVLAQICPIAVGEEKIICPETIA